jgi:hypothetical protein
MTDPNTEKWEVPAEVQQSFRKLDAELVQLTLQLGQLEAAYMAQKAALLVQMDKLSKGRIDTVLKAASEAGLDMNAQWTLDVAQMALTKNARA